MSLVDVRKLSLLRDVVDGAVAEKVLLTGRSRRECLLGLGKELGWCIEFFKVDDWYLATAQLASVWDEIDLYHENADFDRCADVDIESRQSNFAIATSVENAAIAVMLRLLDHGVDVFFTEQDAADFYPPNFTTSCEDKLTAVENYIRQERWFGDVPQWGRAEELHGMVVSDDGKIWYDGYGNKIRCA